MRQCARIAAALALCGWLAACGKAEPPPGAAASSAPPAAEPTAAPAAGAAPATPPAADAGAAPAPAATKELPKGPAVKVTPELAAEGKALYLKAGCNACHGGNGGGGMCPPLSNEVWVYGDSDDILRTIITEGSGSMAGYGKPRIGKENVVGIMPPFGPVLKEGDADKLIAFIRSLHKGGAAKAGAK